MLLYYAHTYPNAKICYQTSNMILHVESYAAYLVMHGARSRIANHYSLSNHPTKPTNPSDVNNIGPIITESKTLQHVVGSAADSQTGGLFINDYQIVQHKTCH